MKLDKYIYWRLKTERVGLDRFLDVKNDMETRGVEVTSDRKSCWEDWTQHDVNYKIDIKGDYVTIYTSELINGFWELHAYTASRHGDKDRKNGDLTGWQAHNLLFDLVELKTGKSMKAAFGTVPASVFRKCTPRTPFYIMPHIAGIKIRGAAAGDFSSHYPASACGPLPDAHTAVYREGRWNPTSEYPFAFYSSGHVAEFGYFDTHDWIEDDSWVNVHGESVFNSIFGLDRSGAPMYNEKDKYTILMRAAPVQLDEVWEYLYKAKSEGDPEAKAIMNMSIGTLHRNPVHAGVEDMNDYYHVAAVILCRANQKIISKAKLIRRKGGVILQIVVDGMVWIHCPVSDVAVDENAKKLGAFVRECKDAIYCSTGKTNNYTITDEAGNVIKEAHAGNRR